MKSSDFFKEKNKIDAILSLASKNENPFYVFDKENFTSQVETFRKIFDRHIPRFTAYYAIKSNPHDYLIKEVIKRGMGLDVSSGRELKLAKDAGAEDILFSGPGKTDTELDLAFRYPEVVLNVDSFGELARLKKIAAIKKKKIRIGVRINTSIHGIWDKFGIPMERLADFWNDAGKDKYVLPSGIQMHMSWNTSAMPYTDAIKKLGNYLRENFSPEVLAGVKFVDFGGGFVPDNEEGTFISDKKHEYHMDRSIRLEDYAKKISKAIEENLQILEDCEYFAEPGRILSTYAMHIVLKVIDVKAEGIVIANGGNNMVGWEKFEECYSPVFNLTHPGTKEIPVIIYGSLCTPHDIWGYYCFADKMEVGDVLVLPNQGAYTYTLAQSFIKDIPVVLLI